MTLKKSLLYYFVCDALEPYSENRVVRNKQNPVVIQLNGRLYSIHISYVHDSGNRRDNEDEVRIQLSRGLVEQQQQRQKDGQRVAFIGFFGKGKIFVAWDPRYVFSLRANTVASVYARQSQEERTKRQLAATHQFKARFLNETSFAIALPSSALGFYLENVARFHRLRSESLIQDLMSCSWNKVLAGNAGSSEGKIEVEQQEGRERFTFSRRAYSRNPRFKQQVLDAYDHTCCICTRQLSIVQAAHIIPHSEPDCPDTVINGLALCVEHHRLYDDALLLPGPGRLLVFNGERAEYLCQIKQERGLDAIAEQHGQEFSVPALVECRPSDNYLQRGLEIRLGQRSFRPDETR